MLTHLHMHLCCLSTGVKGYVTINVLIFDTELEDLEKMVFTCF